MKSKMFLCAVFLFFLAGTYSSCNKKSGNEPECPGTSFDEAEMNRITIKGNKFLAGLSVNLNDEQKLSKLVDWLKAQSCIVDAKVSDLCVWEHYFSPCTTISEIVVSYEEDGFTRKFFIDVPMTQPLKVAGFHGEYFLCWMDNNVEVEHFHPMMNIIRVDINPPLGTPWSQILAIINSDASLLPLEDIQGTEVTYQFNLEYLELAYNRSNRCFVTLESKNGYISWSALEAFKVMPEVASVDYLYGFFSVLYPQFGVKLKPTTTYEQLQELAKQNNCIVLDNPFVEFGYTILIPKTSRLNAIQMSCLFFETGLFEYCEPSRSTLFPK